MRAARVSMRAKRAEAPEWIFQWRPLGGRWMRGLVSVILSAGIFLLLFAGLRVRFPAPAALSRSAAVVMQVPGGPEGDAVVRWAREEGPFPARFQAQEWEGYAAMEREVLASLETADRPVHGLVEWEDGPPAPVRLSEPGEIELPRRSPRNPVVRGTGAQSVQWSAQLRSLERGVRIVGEVDPDLSGIRMRDEWVSDPPRFLIRVEAGGTISESLAVGEGAEAISISSRLRGLKVRVEPRYEGWLPAEVFFKTRSDHGPEPR